jgi:hypothetical protein
MFDLKKRVNDYLVNNLLSVQNLSVDKYENDITNNIIDRLFSKKYRKYKIDPSVKEDISKQLDQIIANNQKIIFTPAFGGYKHHWSGSYPYTDWAEIFNLKFLLEYLAPIFNSYEKGIEIEYESEEVIIEKINNMPQEDINKYTQSWYKLLELFNSKLSDNVKIKYTLAKESYSKEKLFKAMNEKYQEFDELFDTYEDKDYRLSKASTNIMWNGKEDLTNLTEEEKQDYIKKSRVLDEVFLAVDFELREAFFFQENRILLCFSFGLCPEGAEALHIGSCASSMVDFWAGIGILEIREGKIVPRIISKTQFDKIGNDLIKISVDIEELKQVNSNYDFVYVYNGALNFSA